MGCLPGPPPTTAGRASPYRLPTGVRLDRERIRVAKVEVARLVHASGPRVGERREPPLDNDAVHGHRPATLVRREFEFVPSHRVADLLAHHAPPPARRSLRVRSAVGQKAASEGRRFVGAATTCSYRWLTPSRPGPPSRLRRT